MPVWLRVLLAVIVVFGLLFAGAAVLGYRWWMNNKSQLLDAAKHAQSDGETFGRGKQATACIDEALRQVHECGGFQCELKSRLFLDGCMRAAADAHEFCASVPRQNEFLKHAQWTIEECGRRGMATDQRCNRVMQGVGAACDREASK